MQLIFMLKSFCKVEKDKLKKKDVKELMKANHLEVLENLIGNILNSETVNDKVRKKDKFVLKEKEKDILERRFKIKYNKKQTLDTIGQLYGCSRERIRQINNIVVARIITFITPDFMVVNDEIGGMLKELGSVIYYPKKSDFPAKALLKEVVNNIDNRCFDIDFNDYLVVKKGFKTETLFKKTVEIFKNKEKISRDKIEKAFNDVLSKCVKNETQDQKRNYTNVYKILFDKLTNLYFVKIDENLYNIASKVGKRTSKEKDDKMLYWFEKFYPKGVHLPIERVKEEYVKQNLKELFEKCPEREDKAMRYIVSKIKNFDDVIWWGRGIYIHVNNIDVDWSAVDFAIDEVIKLFDSGLRIIKPRAVYAKYKEKFLNANIPNELALVGLIKYRHNPRILILRDQLRDSKHANLETSILQEYEKFILARPEGISQKELRNELCAKRGWKHYQIDFLCTRSNLIYCENGIYHHKANDKVTV